MFCDAVDYRLHALLLSHRSYRGWRLTPRV
jgi:hypothetical protein